MRLMSLTRDTSHAAIGPCGPPEHWPFGDSLRQPSMALLSCTLDCGANAVKGTCAAEGLSSGWSNKRLTVKAKNYLSQA